MLTIEELKSLNIDEPFINIVGKIPRIFDPEEYRECLPPAKVKYAGWFERRAREMAYGGYCDYALRLLQFGALQDETLYHRLTKYSLIHETLREMEMPVEVSFEVYDRDGIKAFIVALDGAEKTIIEFARRALGRSLTVTPDDSKLLLQSVKGAEKQGTPYHPLIARRLFRSGLGSLKEEIKQMRADPWAVHDRINRIMRLIVKRRELGQSSLSLAEYDDLAFYEEFQQDEDCADLESFCYEELERLSKEKEL